MRSVGTVSVLIAAMLCAVVGQLVCSAAPAPPAGFAPVDTVDYGKTQLQVQTAWVKHAFWPTSEVMTQKRYRETVDAERSALCEFLQKVLSPEFQPSRDAVNRDTVAVAALWDESDYLLLSYATKSGYKMRIQDGKDLFLLIDIPESLRGSDIESLVKNTAASVLDLSAIPAEQRQKAIQWTDPFDIGRSKSGQLRYGHSPVTRLPEWYTSIGWWSDGSRVLLAISKGDFSKLGDSPVVPPPWAAGLQVAANRAKSVVSVFRDSSVGRIPKHAH